MVVLTEFYHVRGIRGATTVEANEPSAIYEATAELLAAMVEENKLDSKSIAAVFFSATPDLNAAFPAKAARNMGWNEVPLFCASEINVPGALPTCIRVMLMVNTDLTQAQVKHVYLKKAVNLRDT